MQQFDSNEPESSLAPLHMIDIIRKKRDGGELDAREIAFVAAGAATIWDRFPRRSLRRG